MANFAQLVPISTLWFKVNFIDSLGSVRVWLNIPQEYVAWQKTSCKSVRMHLWVWWRKLTVQEQMDCWTTCKCTWGPKDVPEDLQRCLAIFRSAWGPAKVPEDLPVCLRTRRDGWGPAEMPEYLRVCLTTCRCTWGPAVVPEEQNRKREHSTGSQLSNNHWS